MKLLFSVPSGYHLRELLLPLRNLVESDSSISRVAVVTPAADVHADVFFNFNQKFVYHQNPTTLDRHHALLKDLAPDVVVTNTVGHDEHDYPILKAAADLGIPTVTFIASWDNVWKIDRLQKAGKPIHLADHIIVWNAMMRDHMLRLFPELSAEHIAIIGAPRLDYFWHGDIPAKAEIYRLLGFSDTTKPLIHFSTTELYPMDYVVEAVAEAIECKTIPDAHLYVSVHPGGTIENHKGLEQYGASVGYSFGRVENPPHPNFAYIPTDKAVRNLVGVFRHAAVLVNQSSTTALESLIANVPVVNVAYGKKWDWWRWYRSMVYRDFKQHYLDLVCDNATYMVKNRGQLIAGLQTALKNPRAKQSERDTTVKRMITTVDGTASQKVLTEIKKHAKKL